MTKRISLIGLVAPLAIVVQVGCSHKPSFSVTLQKFTANVSQDFDEFNATDPKLKLMVYNLKGGHSSDEEETPAASNNNNGIINETVKFDGLKEVLNNDGNLDFHIRYKLYDSDDGSDDLLCTNYMRFNIEPKDVTFSNVALACADHSITTETIEIKVSN